VRLAEERWPFGLRVVVLAPEKLALLANALIAIIFVADMATPQTVNTEAFYAIPILLAGFSASRKLTYRIVLMAVLADELAAIYDAAGDNFHWDIIGIENRLLSLVSLATVAILTLAVQRAAARIGSLSAIEAQRGRHVALSRAADGIVAALDSPNLDATIVAEAAHVLGQPRVYWCPTREPGECWEFRNGVTRRGGEDDLPSELARFAYGARFTRYAELAFAQDGRNGTAAFDRDCVLTVPIVDKRSFMGFLLVPVAGPERESGLLLIATSFASLVVGALQQARLIADLAAQNRKLNEKQGVIEGLIDAIAHDLRTPLSALSVTLQQAGNGAYGELPRDYAGVLGESKTSVDEISHLAETLLLVARLESGGRRTINVRVGLDALIRELVSEFGAMAATRGIELVTHTSAEAIAHGARGDLRRALANLLVNAIAHTPRGGRVELSTTKSAGRVEVSVADDGYGIDESRRESLFERFSRAAQGGNGSGLGLYIVRRVAEEMGGSVRYEPREPRGSTFTLSLPVAA
jgi:signal transduction histidine kinase